MLPLSASAAALLQRRDRLNCALYKLNLLTYTYLQVGEQTVAVILRQTTAIPADYITNAQNFNFAPNSRK